MYGTKGPLLGMISLLYYYGTNNIIIRVKIAIIIVIARKEFQSIRLRILNKIFCPMAVSFRLFEFI